MYNSWQPQLAVKPLPVAPLVTPAHSPLNSTPMITSPPPSSAQAPSPPSPPSSTPPRSRRASRSSSTSIASPAATARAKPNQRLRLAQLEDVSYPVRYPYHAVPPYLRNDPSQSIPFPEDIVSRKYATSVDERNYLTVFEYQVNGQAVIWDYYTGYVHLTGIWKAIGNSKADIAKLLDISPQLEPVLRRVRGGYLKIQGTWLPYEVAYELSLRIAYHIRYSLIPLFGPQFPEKCLVPTDLRFGQLSLGTGATSSPTPSPPVQTLYSAPMQHAAPMSHHVNAHFGHFQAQGPGLQMSMSSSQAIAPPRRQSLPTAPQIAPPAVQPVIDSRRSFTVTGELPPPVESPFISGRRGSETDLHRRRRLSSSLGQSLPRGRTFSAPHRSNSGHALPRHILKGKYVEWAVGESSDEDDEDSPGATSAAKHEFQEMIRATMLLQELSVGQWTNPQQSSGSSARPAGEEKPQLPSLHSQLMQKPLDWRRS